MSETEKTKLNAEELKELGNKEFGKKNYTKAIEYYSEAITLVKTKTTTRTTTEGNNDTISQLHIYYSNRSASYGGKHEWDRAIEDAKECIQLDPTFIKGYYRLANGQMEKKQYDSAIATIQQGLRIDENNPQLQKQLRTVQQLKRAFSMSTTTTNNNNNNNNNNYQQQQQLPPTTTTLDTATAKELQDLQCQYNQMNREYNTAQANGQKIDRDCRIIQLTEKEVQQLPDSSNCYQSIGKMFVKSTKESTLQYLQNQLEQETKKSTECQSKIQYLQRRLQSQQQNISELLGIPTTNTTTPTTTTASS